VAGTKTCAHHHSALAVSSYLVLQKRNWSSHSLCGYSAHTVITANVVSEKGNISTRKYFNNSISLFILIYFQSSVAIWLIFRSSHFPKHSAICHWSQLLTTIGLDIKFNIAVFRCTTSTTLVKDFRLCQYLATLSARLIERVCLHTLVHYDFGGKCAINGNTFHIAGNKTTIPTLQIQVLLVSQC